MRHTKMFSWPQLVLIASIIVASDCYLVGTGVSTVKAFGLRSPLTRAQRKTPMIMQSSRRDGATEEQIKAAYATYEELMRTNNYGQGYWMDSPFQFFFNIKQAFSRNFGSESKVNPLDFLSNQPKTVDLSDSPFKPLIPDDEFDDAPAPKQKLPAEPIKSSEPAPKKSKTLKKSSKTAAPSSKATDSSLNVRIDIDSFDLHALMPLFLFLHRVIRILSPVSDIDFTALWPQDTDALKKKLAELEEAKKRAEEEAARIKAQLSE